MCVCVRLPVYSRCIVSLGESIRRRERERGRESATDERRRMDGLLYGEEREREREIHPEYSRVLLLAHKLRLFSFPILPL